MYNFRKIQATDPKFTLTRNINLEILNKFREYLKLRTIYSGKTKDGTSGTADSYCNYIIRILLIINEQSLKQFLLNEIEFYNEIKKILDNKDFKMYNREEGNFPGSSIRSFIRFMNFEFLNDDEFIDSSESLDKNDLSKENLLRPFENQKEFLIKEKPKPKEKKEMNITIRQIITRDSKQKMIAFLKANYSCEANCNHELFKNETNNFNYVEAHHLIPLAFQKNFEQSLDVFSNIISLCPSCHRKIHFGKKDEKKKLLFMFYELRKMDLNKSNIIINVKDLFEMYNIT